jgi:Tfp pilus assembly protein PilO
MHVQIIAKSLKSNWTIFAILIGLAIIIVSITGIMYYEKDVDLNNQQAVLKQEIEILKITQTELETVKKYLKIEDKKLSLVLTELLSAAKKSGVNLGETEIGDIGDKDNFRVMPVMISVKGDFNQIGRFINILEKNPRFQTKEIDMSTKETKGIGIISRIRADYILL